MQVYRSMHGLYMWLWDIKTVWASPSNSITYQCYIVCSNYREASRGGMTSLEVQPLKIYLASSKMRGRRDCPYMGRDQWAIPLWWWCTCPLPCDWRAWWWGACPWRGTGAKVPSTYNQWDIVSNHTGRHPTIYTLCTTLWMVKIITSNSNFWTIVR